MIKSSIDFKPKELIEIVIKRRWFIIIPYCLAMIAGITLAFTLPSVYRAQTLILVEPQKVPATYVRSIVTTDIDSRLRTIKQQIMSKTNIEKIMKEFNLFSGEEYQKMYLEDKIATVQRQIRIDVTLRGAANTQAFSISYEDKSPEKAMNVANALANYFIYENLMVREHSAVGTSEFLDHERIAMRKKLEEVEKKLKEYREQHMGELPEQLETNLRILDRLQQQLSEKQVALRDAKNRLAMLKNQVSEQSGIQNQDARVTADGQTVFDLRESLTPEQAKARLAYLKTRYTERHPDVIRLKKIISDFEEKDGKYEEKDEKYTEDTPGESRHLPLNLRTQVKEINLDIRTYTADILGLNKQISLYQKRVENTPKREQDLMSLRRDYQNIQNSYDSLLGRKLEAEIAVNMEKRQKGEQFRILDFARMPQKPVSPNLLKLLFLSMGSGLGIGFGLIFLLEYLDTSFKRREDVESFLGVSVLTTLPLVLHEKEMKKRKINHFVSAVFVMISFVLFSGFSILAYKGVDKTLQFLGRFINL
jgi:polysaccharide chain length determinant protein (PEP-CTERM system associated)